MKKLKKLQLSNELFSKDFPVFRLEQHTFLIQKDINSFLKSSLKNLYIWGHSFRAGIPHFNRKFSWYRKWQPHYGLGKMAFKKIFHLPKGKKESKKMDFL